ncbi:MAG: hypothetical protein RBQ97_10445 [Acholeplasma sp.]|nr:hypothetical protein [Acholeplasma sp.]
MNILERLKEQKNNGQSLTILIVFVIAILGINVYESLTALETSIWWFITAISQTIVISLVVILLERKGGSFASHFLFFAILLSSYPRDLYNYIFRFSNIGIENIIIMLLGAFISIYSLAKMFVHRDEIKKYMKRLSNPVYLLVFVTLINLYLQNSFSYMLMLGLVFLAILVTLEEREMLPLVAAISLVSLINTVAFLFWGAYPLNDFSDYVILGWNMLVDILFVYFAVKFYLDDPTPNNAEYVA